MRNMFILEEESQKTIILCAGISEQWLKSPNIMCFNEEDTVFGKIAVTIKRERNIMVSWTAKWFGKAPRIEVNLPGYPSCIAMDNECCVEIQKGRR